MNDPYLAKLRDCWIGLSLGLPLQIGYRSMAYSGLLVAISTTRYSSRVGTSVSLFDFRRQPCKLYYKKTMCSP